MHTTVYKKSLKFRLCSRAYSRGLGGVKPPWTWCFTKSLLPAQRRL